MSLSRAAAIIDTDGMLLLSNAVFERLFTGSDLIDQARGHLGRSKVGDQLQFAIPDGRTFRVETIAINHGWLIIADDLTKRLAEARSDGLTQLGNRLFFREGLTDLLAKPAMLAGAAILTIDLDRFKGVNEALGRRIGDEVLRIVAKRILSACGAGDIVARLHGDAFGIIQTGQPQPHAAATLAGRLIDLLGRSYLLEGQLINIAASAGIVLPAEGMNYDQSMKNVELALSRAKMEGRGAFRFFEARMDERIQAERALEVDLRRSLAMREFALVYQPQLDLRSMRITGFEALLRWHCPARGIVSPLDFIPLAEQTGIIVPIGEWVLRTACREAASWPDARMVCVNVSAVQFASPNLVTTVLSALAESGLDPCLLELEITESVLLDANGTALATLTSLRELGVRVSLDDFGTGYSSLGYLRSFPFDKIKIDQSFVRGESNETSGRAIVRAIAMLGASFGIATVAEGVETAEQMSRVASDGCTHIQGYLISRPLQPGQIGEFLRQDPQSAGANFAGAPQS